MLLLCAVLWSCRFVDVFFFFFFFFFFLCFVFNCWSLLFVVSRCLLLAVCGLLLVALCCSLLLLVGRCWLCVVGWVSQFLFFEK